MSSDSGRRAVLYRRAHQRWLRRQIAATWMGSYCARHWRRRPGLGFKIHRPVLRHFNAPVRLPPRRFDFYCDPRTGTWYPSSISYEDVLHLEEQALTLLTRLALASRRG